MDSGDTLHNLHQKISEIERDQAELNEQLLSLENDLDKTLQEQSALNARIKEFVGRKLGEMSSVQLDSPEVVNPSSLQPETVDAAGNLEKLLQGSLDALGDKISDRLMAMLKDLKSLPGEMRASRMQEIQQAADTELVDLSALWKHQTLESNIEEVGVDEKESKGIDKNLEKLRALRQMKGKT